MAEFAGKKYYGHPGFYLLLLEMAELHSRKNHDYSGEGDPLKNLRAPERIGVNAFTGVMVRLQDKWSRLEQFMRSGKFLVKGEGVIDTLIDNAVYSLLAILLYKEMANKALESSISETDGLKSEHCVMKSQSNTVEKDGGE